MVRFLHRRWRSHLDDERLILWLDGELPPNAAQGVALHLDECEACRSRFQQLDRTLSLVRKYRESAPDTLSRNFELRLRQELDHQSRKERTFRISRRVGWTMALASAGLTLAIAMPSNATRSFFQHLWERRAATTIRSLQLVPPPPQPQPAPVANTSRPVRTPPPIPPLRPSVSEREAAEVDARYALHRVRACMGEQVDYSQDKDGYVRVQALVDTDARKQELKEALGGIQWLHARIQTIEESLRDAPPPARAATSIPPPTMPVKLAPNHRKLKTPDTLSRDRILEISRQAVTESSLSMQHAWSVRHILSAYPEERLIKLSAESRGKLVSMLLDHTTEWQKTLVTLREDVRPMLELELAGSDTTPEKAPESLMNLFTQAEQIDALTRSLFADSDEPSLDPAAAVPNFYSRLTGLESALAPPRLMSELFTWGHCGRQPQSCRVEASR